MSDATETNPAFEHLLQYLKHSRGFDFTEYKRPSLLRRVSKRMNEVGIQDFEEYEDFLEVHPQEFTELFNTILINVTSFFRDKDAWGNIGGEIVPEILQAKTPGSTIRLWSAGCATGEEAYSLAILMAEAMGIEASRRQVKIYATDIDDEALEQARKGAYSTNSLEKIPEELQKKYFDSSNGSRSVFRQDLRSTLVFGRHDLMHDAPISRLDLLLCRNTLIYFNREAQERIIARFHFALKDTGYLFLGRAETTLTHGDIFKPVNMKHRTFQKVSSNEPRERVETLMQAGLDVHTSNTNASFQLQLSAFENTPPARVVIDRQGSLILANEEARTRLGLDPRDLGRPFRDLELSYRPLELRSLIDQAREEHYSINVRDVERTLPDNEDSEYLDVTVTPLWDDGGRWLGTAISFADTTERQELKEELEQVHHDLETALEELQSTNEELETSSEELQSTVEELQTTNEELQSSNEEMETINEELQSSNSELQAMNDQLRSRTTDLNRLNAFLESILSSVDVGVVVINRDFEIELWNERAEDLWGLRANEVVGESLLTLDIGLPVKKLKEPIEQHIAGKSRNDKIILDASNRRGQPIKCVVTKTIRQDLGGELVGLVLLMEEERK
jgi:two-component system, chemotaxis family, CheB/CheR fusion protein